MSINNELRQDEVRDCLSRLVIAQAMLDYRLHHGNVRFLCLAINDLQRRCEQGVRRRELETICGLEREAARKNVMQLCQAGYVQMIGFSRFALMPVEKILRDPALKTMYKLVMQAGSHAIYNHQKKREILRDERQLLRD